jgi:hypothetical protein
MGRGMHAKSISQLALADDSSSKDIFYHTSPRSVREAIKTDACLWAGMSNLSEQGVYVFDNLAAAKRFGANHPELGATDIWKILLDKIDKEALVTDPFEDGGWLYESEVPGALVPQVITLL